MHVSLARSFIHENRHASLIPDKFRPPALASQTEHESAHHRGKYHDEFPAAFAPPIVTETDANDRLSMGAPQRDFNGMRWVSPSPSPSPSPALAAASSSAAFSSRSSSSFAHASRTAAVSSAAPVSSASSVPAARPASASASSAAATVEQQDWARGDRLRQQTLNARPAFSGWVGDFGPPHTWKQQQ
jgi:hypothetical protein